MRQDAVLWSCVCVDGYGCQHLDSELVYENYMNDRCSTGVRELYHMDTQGFTFKMARLRDGWCWTLTVVLYMDYKYALLAPSHLCTSTCTTTADQVLVNTTVPVFQCCSTSTTAANAQARAHVLTKQQLVVIAPTKSRR